MYDKLEHDELIHESFLFQVHRLQFRTSEGKSVLRDLVKHNGAALILPVLADGSIVMIRNYRYAFERYLWELPCGTLEDGEDPVICAARELTEETGYTAGRMEKLGSYCSCPGYSNEVIHAFLATDLSSGRQVLDDHEDITIEITPDQKVRRMVADNQITDGKTIAALSLYWLKTGNKQ